jgi:Zn-dependent protease
MKTTGGVKIAEVWGIPIAVHPSWLVIFALFAWSLARGHFPIEYPGWDTLTYWIVGAITALLAFGSVLVHELGHSWVALRNGLPIRGITLFVFGGVAQIGREAATPGAEFRIAIAGPLTSFGLAALFVAARVLSGEVDVAAAPALWLARINTTVALFNLLPGFPLDGGRLLRAVVWQATGSCRRGQGPAGGRYVCGDVIAEVETDKGLIDVEVFVSGVIDERGCLISASLGTPIRIEPEPAG